MEISVSNKKKRKRELVSQNLNSFLFFIDTLKMLEEV